LLFPDKDYRIFYPISEVVNILGISINEMRDYIEQRHLILSVRSDDAVGSVRLYIRDAVAFLISDDPCFTQKIPAYLHRHPACFEYSLEPSNEPIVIDGYRRNLGVSANDFESFRLFMGKNTERDVMGATALTVDGDKAHNEHEYTKWLRTTWVNERSPTGAPFFTALKGYKNKDESIVMDWWYHSVNGPGVKLKTNTGTIELKRAQIQKIVSKFRREEKDQKTPSSDN
jgi:hypothetical protein